MCYELPNNSDLLSLPVVSDCEDCGACCLHVGSPPFFPHACDIQHPGDDWLNLPKSLQAEVLAALGRSEGPCPWFDQHTKKCRHYELRPQACRDFERGGAACLRFREELSCLDSNTHAF